MTETYTENNIRLHVIRYREGVDEKEFLVIKYNNIKLNNVISFFNLYIRLSTFSSMFYKWKIANYIK
jgi:hypothetical protein